VPVEDGPEGVGEVVDGVHACQLAGGDERREHGPVLGADLVAGEEGVLPRQRDRADLVLDRVGVQLQRAVLKEADQAGPVREGVADILGQQGLLRDARQLVLQPGLERGDDRGGMLASGDEAVGSGSSASGTATRRR
jgi:hypothetical protein